MVVSSGAQERDRHAKTGPVIYRRQILEADLTWQLGEPQDVGQGCAPNLRGWVGEQPGIRVKGNHPSDLFEERQAQGSGVEAPQVTSDEWAAAVPWISSRDVEFR